MTATILITRPAEAAQSFAEGVRARLGTNCNVMIAPLLRIEHVDQHVELADAATLIFTSVHAVRALASMSDRRDLTCYAVGPATAKAARKAGFQPIMGGGNGPALVDRIKADAPGTPCLYLRGDHVAVDVADMLNASGVETRSMIVYRQLAHPLTNVAKKLLRGADPVIVPLFSPRSARAFFESGPFSAPLGIVAMSENVAGQVPAGTARACITAATADQQSMLDAVCDLWRNANRLEAQDPAQ